jgi:nitroreductase
MSKKDFIKTLETRRSVRAFKKDKINNSKLQTILKACNLAPSSGGLQTFEIYLVKNKKMKEKIVGASRDQTFLAQSPLLLVFCANPSRSVKRFGKRSQLFSVQDASIAAAYAQLTVHALGLDTVWIGAFDETKISKILHLPSKHRPVAMLPIGYGNERPKEKTTRGIKKIFHVIK